MKSVGIALVFRVLALAGIIVAAVPLVQRDPQPFPWELTGFLITALLVYLGTYTEDYRAWRASASNGHPHDAAMFKQLLDLLPPEQYQPFLDSFDFGNAFRASEVQPLNQFVDQWRLADAEFRDRKLEAAKARALITGTQLAEAISLRTRYLNDQLLTVKLLSTDERTDSVLEDARIVNSAARAFSTDYKKLLQLGRRRLTLS